MSKSTLQLDKKSFADALSFLKAGATDKEAVILSDNPLLASCGVMAENLGLQINLSLKVNKDKDVDSNIKEIARRSKFRIRKVRLDSKWWQHNVGPLLGFLGKEKIPVALLPASANSYKLYNPVKKDYVQIDSGMAKKLEACAYIFYRPFAAQKINFKSFLNFITKGQRKILVSFLFMGIAAGLLSLIIPIATGLLFNSIIPNAEKSQLWQMFLILIAVAFGIGAFQLARRFAFLRFEGFTDNAIFAAVLDRLLKLPAVFFRKFTAGDLIERIHGLKQLQSITSDLVVENFISCIFAVFNLCLMFYYSFKLTLIVVMVTLVILVFIILIGVIKYQFDKKAAYLQGKMRGIVSQLIAGIAKIRVTGSENRLFAYWAHEFGAMRHYKFLANKIGAVFQVTSLTLPIAFAIIIFISMGETNSLVKLSVGSFIAFYVAFGVFITALYNIIRVLNETIKIIPAYQRLQPILHTLPEANVFKSDPGELKGAIEFSHVDFRYDKDSPTIFESFSLKIEPGEFVALVGPSGVGKSTLLRLILAFEQPTKGAIYFDNQNLVDLDVDLVRQQMGVVLQNSQLLPGSILENIIGSSQLTLNDAWNVARKIGLDKLIEELPMGMHTLIAEGSGGFSGGQKQLLMIARAIIHHPRILIFDETMSALDNQLQSIVIDGLNSLKMTRIIIAHRLNTVIKADKICVLDGGRIVEAGKYEYLMEKGGFFADFVKRQMV
jgi:NHLM bacteriocin system ABC transporter ATP-binding protein